MTRQTVAIAIVTLMMAVATVNAQRAYDLFQKGLAVERGDGNLAAAIKLYESAIDAAGNDRGLAARALVRIADCYEKLGQRNASAVYQRIIKEYADQSDIVALARARLAALGNAGARTAQSVRQIWGGPDVDPMGTVSADGRYLSFTDWTTGDLSLRDLAAGTSRHLTRTRGWERSGDYAEYSVMSPDGRSVAYAWFVDKGANAPDAKCRCEYELRVMPIGPTDTAQPRVLISGSGLEWLRPAAWLPDGRTLVVLRGQARSNSDVGLVSIADGAYTRVTSLPVSNTSTLTVSPDGKVIAFDVPSQGATGDHNIVLMSLPAGQQLATVGGPGNETSPAFARSGTHLLFVSDRTGVAAVWRQPLRNFLPSGEPAFVASVPPDSHVMGTTADGSAVYFAPGSGTNIFEVDIDGVTDATQRGRLLVERFLDKNNSPSYSPDGARVAYISRRGPRSGLTSFAIVVHSVADRQDRELPLTLPIIDGGLSWFPDGRSLLVVANEPRARGLDYYKVDVATAAAEKLFTTGDAGRPSRKPIVLADGQSILYSDRPANGFEGSGSSLLHVYDLVTHQRRDIATLGGKDEYLTSFTASRDGKQIAYLRSDVPSREAILEIIPATGGAPRAIFKEINTGPTRYSGLAWSVDGREIFLVRETRSNTSQPVFTIWRVPVSGQPPIATRLTFSGVPRSLAVHPSGGRLAVDVTDVHSESGVWILENYAAER